MYSFNLREVLPFLATLPPAILLTFQLTLISALLSGILGVALAVVRVSGNRFGRALATFYVEVFRNTPIIVLVYLVYFGLPQFGIRADGFDCAILAMTLNSGAFMTEIFRSGIIAVPKGQYEAARAQGMTAWQMFRLVIFPQILRVSYAPLGNQLIGVVMASSVASIITVEEITAWMFNSGAVSYRYFETFLTAAVVYLLVCQTINLGRVAVGYYLFRRKDRGVTA